MFCLGGLLVVFFVLFCCCCCFLFVSCCLCVCVCVCVCCFCLLLLFWGGRFFLLGFCFLLSVIFFNIYISDAKITVDK